MTSYISDKTSQLSLIMTHDSSAHPAYLSQLINSRTCLCYLVFCVAMMYLVVSDLEVSLLPQGKKAISKGDTDSVHRGNPRVTIRHTWSHFWKKKFRLWDPGSRSSSSVSRCSQEQDNSRITFLAMLTSWWTIMGGTQLFYGCVMIRGWQHTFASSHRPGFQFSSEMVAGICEVYPYHREKLNTYKASNSDRALSWWFHL